MPQREACREIPIMNDNQTLFEGMDSMDALSLYSETDARYRIEWDCGGAEAARRQRVAGQGAVVDGKYVREVPHELFAEKAAEDPNATVEEL